MQKLEAIRQMFELCGLQHLSALDTDGASAAAFAERILDRENIAQQQQGFYFNDRAEVTLSPSLYSFDAATWTAASNRLTQTGKFTDANVGQTVSVTSGTATVGEAVVTATDGADYIELDTQLDPSNQTGVVGVAVNNVITLPEEAIAIDSTSITTAVQLGSVLYDKDTNSKFFDDDVTVAYTALVEFNCVPEAFALYVMYTAAERFCVSYCKDKTNLRFIGSKLREAQAQWNIADQQAADLNVLDNNFGRMIRGQRPATKPVYGAWR